VEKEHGPQETATIYSRIQVRDSDGSTTGREVNSADLSRTAGDRLAGVQMASGFPGESAGFIREQTDSSKHTKRPGRADSGFGEAGGLTDDGECPTKKGQRRTQFGRWLEAVRRKNGL
jgi:hypothetical protein